MESEVNPFMTPTSLQPPKNPLSLEMERSEKNSGLEKNVK